MCSKDGEGKKKHRKIGKESEPKILGRVQASDDQKARAQILFLTAKSRQRKGSKGNFCKASRSSLERVRCSKFRASGAIRKFREKAILALQIFSPQVRFLPQTGFILGLHSVAF